MKFDHVVKYNGVYYPAEMEVPVEEVEKKAEVKQSTSALLDEEELPKKKPGRPKKEQ